MLAIIGILIVIGAILGGYLLEHGNMLVLLQPAELLVIGGAALGTLLIANPLHTTIAVLKGFLGVLKPSRFTRKFYLQTLVLLNDIFSYARKNGVIQLEGDVEDPKQSPLFSKHAWFLADRVTLAFVCDTLRMCVTGGVNPFDLEQMMETDIEVQQHERSAPVTALTAIADSLPGLGIVAAVLGIIVTMGALGGPPEQIGHKVAAALVGTFLGVLLAYGFVGPVASNLQKQTEAYGHYLFVIRTGLISFIRDSAPILAVEYARRAIPTGERPSFTEMENACKAAASAASGQTVAEAISA
jgi:chemotaxis protein MotA